MIEKENRTRRKKEKEGARDRCTRWSEAG